MFCISRNLGAKAKISPILARAQGASVSWLQPCHIMVPLLSHAPHLLPPVPRSLSELISCLSRVSPLGRWIPKAGERHVEPRVRLLPRGSPRGVKAWCVPLCGKNAPSVGPGPGAEARSLRPAMLLSAQLCGWDFVSTDGSRQARRQIASETPKFSPPTNVFRD